MRTPRLIVVAALAVAAVSIHSPSPAAAQAKPDPAQMEEAKKHFFEGKKKYDAGDKQGAVEEFKEAYKLSRNALLLYNIGFVYDELKDKPLAVHYYEKFLKDAPDNDQTKANRKLASDRLPVLKKEIADEEAKAAGGTGTGGTGTGGTGTGGTGTGDTGTGGTGAGGTGTGDTGTGGTGAGGTGDTGTGGTGTGDTGTGDKAPAVTKFTHEVIEEAPPKLPLDVTAMIPEDADWKLTLYFRAAGQDDFKSTKMKPRYHEIVGRIPPTAMLGTSVQYYIEVKDKAGTLVSNSGRASSPNVVYIDKDAKPHFYRDLEGGSGSMVGEDDDGDIKPEDIEPKGGKVDTGGRKRDKIWWAKWGATAGAAAILTVAIIANRTAANNANAIEVDAANSATCQTNPPCHQFSNDQKTWQTDGQFNETLSNVMLVTGAAVAVGAGVLWWYDMKRNKRAAVERDSKPMIEEDAALPRRYIAPVVTDNYVGAAYGLSF